MEERSYQQSEGGNPAPGMGQYEYQSPGMNREELEGKFESSHSVIGMYANEDPYGDEIEGDEDRNDGLNALVTQTLIIAIELIMGHWL